MNINTTTNTEGAKTPAARKPTETLEQGIERIREVFRQARRMDIRITQTDGADRLGSIIEGGVNGYMFALQRGVDISDVPEPIIEVLRNAGVDFTALGGWKSPLPLI